MARRASNRTVAIGDGLLFTLFLSSMIRANEQPRHSRTETISFTFSTPIFVLLFLAAYLSRQIAVQTFVDHYSTSTAFLLSFTGISPQAIQSTTTDT